jgi:hypothetical protein
LRGFLGSFVPPPPSPPPDPPSPPLALLLFPAESPPLPPPVLGGAGGSSLRFLLKKLLRSCREGGISTWGSISGSRIGVRRVEAYRCDRSKCACDECQLCNCVWWSWIINVRCRTELNLLTKRVSAHGPFLEKPVAIAALPS